MINCSRCGAPNPADNTFCGKCGQLLRASGAANQPSTSDMGLPDWLRESPDDSGAPASSAPASGTPPAPAGTEMPSWLSEIGLEDDRQSAVDSAQAPDWLAQLQQTPPTASGATEDLPPWLRSNEAQPPAAVSQPEQPVPNWLHNLEQESPSQSSSLSAVPPLDELPAWLKEDQPPAAQSSASAEPLADWLHEFDPPSTQPPTASAPASADDLPAWLKDDQPTLSDRSAPARGGTGGEATPDWLQDWSAPDTTSATPPADPGRAPATAPQELPSWLADLEAPAVTAAAPTPPVDDIPPWLRAEESPTSDAALPSMDVAPPQSGPAELPAWLMEDTADPGTQDLNVPLPDWSSEFGAELPQQMPDAPSQQLPDWLHEMDPSTPQAAAPTAQQHGVEEVPDWLRAAEPTPPPAIQSSPPTDLPDWLREMEPASTQPPSASTPSAGPTSPGDPGLPSWLVEESPTAVVPEAPQAPPANQVPAGDLPAWLLDAGESTPTSAVTGDTVALPSWLADDTSSAGQPTQPLTTGDLGTTQQLPSWLLDESAGTGIIQPTTEPTTRSTADELPPWLAGGDEAHPGVAASSLRGDADELPPWLAGGDEPAGMPAATYGQPQPDEVPPWLADDRVSPIGRDIAQSPDQTQADDLPSWLVADAPPTPSDAGRAAAQGASTNQRDELASAETVEFPTWLSDTAPAQPAQSHAATDTDLPPWLSGIEAEAPAQPAESTSTLPAWLEESTQPVNQAQPTKPAQPAAGQSEFLGGLDLPAWLREDGDTQQTSAPVKATAPEWLKQISPESDDAVPVQEAVAAPPVPRVVRTPERVESMRLLEQLIDQPAPEPVPQAPVRRRSWLLPVLIGLILLILVGAILFILLNPRLGLSLGASPVPVPSAEAAAQVIADVPARRPVVLAYEWDALRLGDLRPLEEAVIVQLAARNDVPLIFLSTDPQGALLATERTEQVRQIGDNFHDQYGLGYVNLGFKAGGPLALRQFARNDAFGALFAQDASGNDLRANDVVMQSMCGAATTDGCAWENIGLLIVMADEVEDVRGWFEQVRSEHPQLQTLVLTTAEIAPQVTPYAAAPNTHMLAGLAAAEALSRARGIQDERLGRQVDAAAVGGAIFALCVLIGGPIAAFNGYRTRREAEVEEWEP